MTNKEMIAGIRSAESVLVVIRNNEIFGIEKSKIDSQLDALDNAVAELKHNGKYRWHDLKKDPSDLPEIDEDVLVYDGCGYYVFTLLDHGMQDDVLTWEDSYGYYQDLDEIIAWRYINEFEEE